MTRVNSHSSESAAIDVDRIATSPGAADQVPKLLKQIALHGEEFVDGGSSRLQLLEAAKSLVHALETPREAILRHCWSHLASFVAIETCIDIDLFACLSNDDKPKSIEDLAVATRSDQILLSRLLKHLAATHVISEAGPDEYRRTGLSTTLAVEKYSDTFPCMSHQLNPGIRAIPGHLKDINYANPAEFEETPLARGLNTDLNFFQILQQDALKAKEFGNHMRSYRQGRPSWMDVGFFPVKERLIEEVDISQGQALLVDMGASIGHDLAEFQRKWPNLPGRLVLQDLPEVVPKPGTLHESIEVMAHDFFTEQPVKGARAYYMHSVLHDWPDEKCQEIFANLLPAMRPGYSKVLINENVIPDTGASWETTSLDFIMMSVGSCERTEKQWRRLLESAGLSIVKIWTLNSAVESLIECELVGPS